MENKRLKLFTAVSILIIALSVVYVYARNFREKSGVFYAKQGYLDLEEWKGNGKENIELGGEWEFYPGKFIDPTETISYYKENIVLHNNPADNRQDSTFSDPLDKDFLCENGGKHAVLPGDWGRYLNEDGNSQGIGTYRLLIRLPMDGIYGIKTETIRSSCRIFLNGQMVGCIGNPSKTNENYEASSKYSVSFVGSEDGFIEILIHVANYNYHVGGIIRNIKFGSFETILNHVYRERALEAFVIGITLIVGLIFLFTFLLRGYNPYQGYFSLGNLFMALYLSVMNNQLLGMIIKYNLDLRIKIQFLSALGVTYCFLGFIYHFLREHSRKMPTRVLSISILTIFIFLILNIRKSILPVIEIWQIGISLVVILAYAYISWVLLRAIKARTIFLGYIMMVSSSLMTYWAAMFFKAFFEIDLGYLHIYLILGIVIGIILWINNRFYEEFKEVRELTEERLEKEFKYFYSQISPHFLYNTINTIIALSYDDAEKTRKALNNLSVYFRGKLEMHMEKALIPLEDELDMVRAYLDMEQMRYGEKLRVEYDIDDNIEAFIPPLTLQPLVENAVNHGIKPKEGGGKVKVFAGPSGRGKIEIIIEDDGVGMTPEKQDEITEGKSGRLGFKNVVKKVRMLKGFSIGLKSIVGAGTSIRLTLPGSIGSKN